MAVHEIARLQQHPNRQHRGNVAVDQQNHRPGDDRIAAGQPIVRKRKIIDTKVHGQIHQPQRQQRRDQQLAIELVHPEPHRHGHRHREPDGKHRLGIHVKNRGDHQAENRQHQHQREEQDQQKQIADARCDDSARDISHRLAAVAQRDRQRTEIMHGSDEDAAEQDPQQRR